MRELGRRAVEDVKPQIEALLAMSAQVSQSLDGARATHGACGKLLAGPS
jgi:hypothetical protein